MSAWTIKAWPSVLSPEAAFLGASFRHWSTDVLDPSAKPGSRCGQTVWVTKEAPTVGIAWDWAEVMPWIVVLADPMNILTNVRLERSARQPLGADALIVIVNDVVSRLPWQKLVRRRLSDTNVQRKQRQPAVAV